MVGVTLRDRRRNEEVGEERKVAIHPGESQRDVIEMVWTLLERTDEGKLTKPNGIMNRAVEGSGVRERLRTWKYNIKRDMMELNLTAAATRNQPLRSENGSQNSSR